MEKNVFNFVNSRNFMLYLSLLEIIEMLFIYLFIYLFIMKRIKCIYSSCLHDCLPMEGHLGQKFH